MIIGFTGQAGSGKDTAGAYLIKQYNFERKAFADPLKKSIAALFDIPFWEVDKFKLDDTVFVAIGYKNEPVHVDLVDKEGNIYLPGIDFPEKIMPSKMWSPISEFTFRQFAQRYGTEAHRDIPEIGYNFWADLTLPVGGFYAGRKICITDCRFANEVERIQTLGGIVIKLLRENSGVLLQTAHRSEQTDLLNANATIENNGTIEELYEQIDNLLITYPNDQ